MNRRFFLFLFALLAAFALPAGLSAADAGAAKGRMRDRVGQIDQLKLAEVVGENNRGFLELRKNDNPAAGGVVQAENADRSEVFSDTAARTNSSTDAVGRAFAKQIAAASARGVWVQREDGSWAKK
ncbi:MAG TPA: DUF1318 domain-containing protein [Opitutaceae bacterium]|nr:DUF1318 domain-containing protein [Opitutaceae bacterium]